MNFLKSVIVLVLLFLGVNSTFAQTQTGFDNPERVRYDGVQFGVKTFAIGVQDLYENTYEQRLFCKRLGALDSDISIFQVLDGEVRFSVIPTNPTITIDWLRTRVMTIWSEIQQIRQQYPNEQARFQHLKQLIAQ